MYIGFLVNGRLAMIFETETEAYNAFKTGGLGLVGKVVDDGKVEVLYKDCNFMGRGYHQGRYYYHSSNIANRLEIVNPDHMMVQYVKRRLIRG